MPCHVMFRKGPITFKLVLVNQTQIALIQQEAQLSQRYRAILRVIDYFAKFLKVLRNDTHE